MLCSGNNERCLYCGREWPGVAPPVLRRKCTSQQAGQPPAPGLGDYTEALLKSIGVTQDRYKAAKELFGLAPTCNCDKRKAWLNRVGEWWLGS